MKCFTQPCLLHFSLLSLAALRNQDNSNIVTKSSTKIRRRVICLFPGSIKPLKSGGTIGKIQHLDSMNPTMYIDYPQQGRLWLRGTFVHTKNKYVALQYSTSSVSKELSKREVISRGALQEVLVFAEYGWETPDGVRTSGPNAVPQEVFQVCRLQLHSNSTSLSDCLV